MIAEIKFKEGVDEKEIELLTIGTWALVQIFALELALQGETLTITSIMDKAKGRISDSHAQGRAIDARTYDWKIDPNEFCNNFNKKYKKLGAISSKIGVQTPCVYHNNGGGWHIHLQSIN